MARIDHILIVGGGTSGWLSAAYLAKKLGCGRRGGVKITLIESSEIATVGVGEATIPPIREIIAALGVDEARFMRDCAATCKLAIKFPDWLRLPETGGRDRHSFYHAFGNFGLVGQELLAAYWLLEGARSGRSFVDYTMIEGKICDAGRAPKRIDDPPYGGPLQYAYHFDARLVARLLKKIGRANGVKHVIGTVSKVELEDDGAIKAVDTKEHGRLSADLYIDCTGFAAHLIERAMATEFHGLSETLFCDKAVACQVPYDNPRQPIPPYTTSTAQENGWTWDIPLGDRRGIGYVYSSRYTDRARAEEVLHDYVGLNAKDLAAKDMKVWHLDMRIGSRRRQWHKNCVAIGLSAGFIEPLESTGIYLVDIALRWLADFMPPVEQMPLAAAQFNARMNASYADIVDFIKMHYALSRRTDSDFWIDNRRPETWPDSLRDNLAAWRYRLPSVFEFTNLPKVFGLTNYLQVLYGMDCRPDLSGLESRYTAFEAAAKQVRALDGGARGGLEVLPDHRAFIDQLYRGGYRPGPAKRRPRPDLLQ